MPHDDGGPCADRFFGALCREHLVDADALTSAGGRIDWRSVGARGVGNDDIEGIPDGFPRFRYGIEDGTDFLSVVYHDAYYVRRGDQRSIHVPGILPEAVLAVAEGRPLSDIIRLPGLEDEAVQRAQADEKKNESVLTLAKPA